MQHADLFVLPSLKETWGLAINEAMCMSRPVVVSSTVGCGPDLVEQNENGMIFNAGDEPALSNCLRTALADPDRLRAWVQMRIESCRTIATHKRQQV